MTTNSTGRGPCVAGTRSVGDKFHLLSEPGYQAAGVVLMGVLESPKKEKESHACQSVNK